jgi:multidrug efflux pump subunit AcrA (membrane-fusion protein)
VLDLEPTLSQLESLRGAARPDSPTLLAARQALLARALQASFEADDAISRIQDEQAVIEELEAALEASHDRQVGLLNLSAGLFSAGAAIGTGLTLSSKTATTGIWITTVSSSIAAILTTVAVVAPTRSTAPIHSASAMLAPLLDAHAAPGAYPPMIWRYLNVPVSDEANQRSPREVLLVSWR